jgi:hypothetical protein
MRAIVKLKVCKGRSSSYSYKEALEIMIAVFQGAANILYNRRYVCQIIKDERSSWLLSMSEFAGGLANYSFGASSPVLREIFKTSAFSMIANG